MTKGIHIPALEQATGKTWPEWLAFFEDINARDLSHKEIAKKVSAHGVPGWWAQSVTVAYEQEIGRRVPGQDCDGQFAVSVTKTLPGTMDDALQAWIRFVKGLGEFSDVAITRGPDIHKTETWRYWCAGLADGSRMGVNIYQKLPDKASLSVYHEKIESAEQSEHWRTFWKRFIADL